jgi:zinc D-Ala-D-Ala carboxypeptidase
VRAAVEDACVKLSAFFTLEELTFSDTAARLGIDNAPPEEVVGNLKLLAYTLDEVRARLGRPVHVNSGYRCPALERVIAGDAFSRWCVKHGRLADDAAWFDYLATKAHPDGRSADFTAREFGSPYDVAREIAASEIAFDQLIYEHTWVHLGIARPGAASRRQVLTLMPGGAYSAGIVLQAAA